MLTARKQKALESLLVAKTRKEAAELAGINITTLRSYFKDEEFLTAYREAYGAVVDEATRQAQRYLSSALETLDEISRNKEAADMARVSASRSLVEYTVRLAEHNDLAARIAELERQAAD